MVVVARRGDGEDSVRTHPPPAGAGGRGADRIASWGETVVGAGGGVGAGAGGASRHHGPLHGFGGATGSAFGVTVAWPVGRM
jgi:hypothetical protein